MRRLFVVFALLILVSTLAVSSIAFADSHLRNRFGESFIASPSGDQEVPPVDTDGFGRATLHLDPRELRLRYKVRVFDTPNVTQAHIHLGRRGENGPVVAFLFGFVPGGVTVDGVLAEGNVWSSDLIGPLQGQTISDLAWHLRNGNAYINIHTVAHPPGEIRGQIIQVR